MMVLTGKGSCETVCVISVVALCVSGSEDPGERVRMRDAGEGKLQRDEDRDW